LLGSLFDIIIKLRTNKAHDDDDGIVLIYYR